MKYICILLSAKDEFIQAVSFETLQEAEAFGYNHTDIIQKLNNDIPVKNRRCFRVYEKTNRFNLLEVAYC